MSNVLMKSPSGAKSSGESEVLFLIDWDDTVFPTHFLRCANLLSGTIQEMLEHEAAGNCPRSRMSAEIRTGLRVLEEAACEMIRAASELGKVVFVTNSSSHWIPFTSRRFFPALAPLLEKFECHSARPAAVEAALASREGVSYVPSMGTDWKKAAFKRLAADFQHFVSVGDGLAERCAVLALAPRKSAKAVRFDPQPSLELMIDQLCVLTSCLGAIVDHADSGDVLLFADASFKLIPQENQPHLFN